MVFENFATQNQMIRALRPFVTNSDVPPHRWGINKNVLNRIP
jgi:hypothetical protein